MNSTTAFKKFATGYHLYGGVRISVAILLPSLLLFHYGLLVSLIMIPFGVIMVGLTDSPGAFDRRTNSLIIATATYFVVALIAGYSRDILWLAVVELLIFSVVLSLCGVYGSRMTSIGTSALMCFIFYLDKNFVSGDILLNAFYMSCGGILYLLIYFVSYKLRPYKLIQQMLGEHLMELAGLLRLRSNFYNAKMDYTHIMDQMIKSQVVLREQQENLREAVLKTRQIVQESTNKSRGLLLTFMDSMDLFERILLSQQDYEKLHAAFDGTHILQVFGRYISILAYELQQTGLAIQQGRKYSSKRDLSLALERCRDAFYSLRSRKMTTSNMEDFIMLRQILYSLQDLTDRIKKLNLESNIEKTTRKEAKADLDFKLFIPKQEYGYRIFLDNISFHSGQFRHAIRVATALLAGLIISRIFNLGHHSYWVLMTIIIILKPSYSLARQKNIDRISGTVVGGIISFLIIYFVRDETAVFIIFCFATLMACSLLRINYFIYAIGMTMMVILSYDFISSKIMSEVLLQRVLNSGIGCAIGYAASLLVLPNWEHQQKKQYAGEMLEANKAYFLSVSRFFAGEHLDTGYFKLCRKNAFIALANLSDNFQRMMSDPKRQRVQLAEYHQFVVTSHMISSYIASLSYYAQSLDERYISAELKEVVAQIAYNFDTAIELLQTDGKFEEERTKKHLPANQKLLELLDQRKKELRESGPLGEQQTSIRKFLTDYKTINELFELINVLVYDEAKIMQKFNEVRSK